MDAIREFVVTAEHYRDHDRHVKYFAKTYRDAEKAIPRLAKQNTSWVEWKIERNPELDRCG